MALYSPPLTEGRGMGQGWARRLDRGGVLMDACKDPLLVMAAVVVPLQDTRAVRERSAAHVGVEAAVAVNQLDVGAADGDDLPLLARGAAALGLREERAGGGGAARHVQVKAAGGVDQVIIAAACGYEPPMLAAAAVVGPLDRRS